MNPILCTGHGDQVDGEIDTTAGSASVDIN